jgi:hypothetical protein
MKVLKMLVVAAIATAVLTSVSYAGGDKTCCEKAAAEGKECTHKCCIEAKKAGKICEKCNPKKAEKKEEKKS